MWYFVLLFFGCWYQCNRLPGRLVSEMTCYESGGTSNPTHSLTNVWTYACVISAGTVVTNFVGILCTVCRCSPSLTFCKTQFYRGYSTSSARCWFYFCTVTSNRVLAWREFCLLYHCCLNQCKQMTCLRSLVAAYMVTASVLQTLFIESIPSTLLNGSLRNFNTLRISVCSTTLLLFQNLFGYWLQKNLGPKNYLLLTSSLRANISNEEHSMGNWETGIINCWLLCHPKLS